jgi:phage terminase small subunit
MALTAKQQRFVDEYLKDLNATAAAERAAYKHPNKQGPALLVNLGVQEAIVAAKADRAARCKLSATWVIRRLRKEATAKGPNASPSARVRALELLGKHIGLFPDRHEVNVGQNITVEIVERLIDARPPGTSFEPTTNGGPARGPTLLPPQ